MNNQEKLAHLVGEFCVERFHKLHDKERVFKIGYDMVMRQDWCEEIDSFNDQKLSELAEMWMRSWEARVKAHGASFDDVDRYDPKG